MTGTVLVGVLKDLRDRRILLQEHWYRIPLAFVPKRRFTHIAFYQPSSFGRQGKRVLYYARITKREVKKRCKLLPTEPFHLRAGHEYVKYSFRTIRKLKKPICNVIPRRVSFGFTSLKTLHSARDILELYHVAPTEQIIERELKYFNIPYVSQYRFTTGSFRKHYRLDLAIFCLRGNIAVECDNRKAHSSKLQKLKDREKDKVLKKLNWRVIRLTEEDILENLDSAVFHIQKLIFSLGGTV